MKRFSFNGNIFLFLFVQCTVAQNRAIDAWNENAITHSIKPLLLQRLRINNNELLFFSCHSPIGVKRVKSLFSFDSVCLCAQTNLIFSIFFDFRFPSSFDGDNEKSLIQTRLHKMILSHDVLLLVAVSFHFCWSEDESKRKVTKQKW